MSGPPGAYFSDQMEAFASKNCLTWSELPTCCSTTQATPVCGLDGRAHSGQHRLGRCHCAALDGLPERGHLSAVPLILPALPEGPAVQFDRPEVVNYEPVRSGHDLDPFLTMRRHGAAVADRRERAIREPQ